MKTFISDVSVDQSGTELNSLLGSDRDYLIFQRMHTDTERGRLVVTYVTLGPASGLGTNKERQTRIFACHDHDTFNSAPASSRV